MPQIDRQVTGLNQDVVKALQAIRNPANATVAEAQEVRTAILKDGTIDAAEADLIAELTHKDSRTISVSGKESATPVISNLSMFDDDAQGPLAISLLALGRRKAEIIVDKGVTRVKEAYREAERDIEALGERFGQKLEQLYDNSRDFMTELFTYQYGEGSDDERQANCGPASAAMIIKQFGMEPPHLTDMRKMVKAPVGNGNGAFALTTQQVGQAVQKTAASYGKNVSFQVSPLSSNVDTALRAIKAKLDAGEQVILLSSNIAVQSGNRGKGHYVVVRDVKADGTLVVDDPQARTERGLSREHSRAEFANSLRRRTQLFGRANEMISFKEIEPAPPKP